MNYMNLLVTNQDHITEIVLNRPSVRNAFDEMMIAELTDAYRIASNDAATRAVLLRANGPSFCGGADLAWMARSAAYTHQENLEDARLMQQMFHTIANCPKVTIAAVHGAAIGGGVGLAAVHDVVIAANDTAFALSEVRLGLIPAVIAPYIVERVGVGVSRGLFVTGAPFDAQTALRIGLVQHVVAPEALEEAIRSSVDHVRRAGPQAVSAAKQLLRDITGKSAEEAAEITIHCIANLRVSPEGQEGVSAFLEKRSASFHFEK